MYRDAEGRKRRREKTKSGDGIPSPHFNGPCKGQTELFFRSYTSSKEGRALARQVKAICGTCRDLKPCREWGIKHEEFGIWGAMTEQERRAYRINNNIILERPEALTVDTNMKSQRKEMTQRNVFRDEEVEEQWP